MFLSCCFVLFCPFFFFVFFFFDYPFIELEPFCRVEACGREVKTANLAVPDPDGEIRGWGRGGWSSRPLDKWGRGCWSEKKKENFSALRASVWSKNKGGPGPRAPGPPGPSPGSATAWNL